MPKKITIEDMHNLAESRNGKFLSVQYIGALIKHKWQCSNNHVWEARPNDIKNGKWCPYCAGKAKLTIEYMNNIASKNGGKFLSTEYINSITKYKWQCDKGHVWEATADSINQGSWCNICYYENKKFTIQDMQKFAANYKGKFLSTEYINSRTKYKWQCDKGHVLEARYDKINNKNWCARCSNKEKLTTNHMKTIALKNKCKFLSTEYINSRTKYKWQCDKGHVWEARYNEEIRIRIQCPHCWRPSRGEEICRMTLTKMFNEPFIKCRPYFLKNKRNLELDGFCEELNIAFEYHGLQHFEPIDYYGGENTFLNVQIRDKLKLELCEKQGVKVIVVPTFPLNFDKFTCQAIIEHSVIKAGIEIPSTWIRAVDKFIDAA